MITMTWPQYLRGECCVDGNPIRLMLGHEVNMVFVLLVRRGIVSKEDLVEFLWPDPDKEPNWSWNCLFQYSRRLRKKGVNITVYYGRGLEIRG